jgi:hypothetical protein
MKIFFAGVSLWFLVVFLVGKGLDLCHQGEGFRVFLAGFLSWVLVLVVMGRE